MEKTICPSVGPKVSQIATIFQKKPIEMPQETSIIRREHHQHHQQETQQQHQQQQTANVVNVVRTESHAARFNNARALFEKLGVENKGQRSSIDGRISHSSSKEDNLNEECYDREQQRERSPSPSPKRKQYPLGTITNGITTKMDAAKIYNVSRMKMEKPEKPEKPERKFNSKELIEKQKNWTSHFTKTRTTRFNSDPNRCDIIRTVPGTTLISGTDIYPKEPSRSASFSSKPTELSLESPPSPPIRQPPPPPPPEIKPRHIKIVTSPNKIPPIIPPNKPQTFIKTSPTKESSSPIKINQIDQNNSSLNGSKSDDLPEKFIRKRSIDEQLSSSSFHSNNGGLTSPGHGLSSSSSPVPSASSGPSSPIHTEDEKQENEDTEKPDRNYNDEGKF